MVDLNLTLCYVLTSLLVSAVPIAFSNKVVFTFPEFPYKETSKNVSTGISKIIATYTMFI